MLMTTKKEGWGGSEVKNEMSLGNSKIFSQYLIIIRGFYSLMLLLTVTAMVLVIYFSTLHKKWSY